MAYPPAVPSGARINTTPQVDTHPADHLEIHAALTDIVTVLGSDPAGDAADVTARFALEVPVGVVLPYGGASAPAGWTLCDGTAVSRATYATLFGIIGTSFGVGDGTTTFNVPNLNNRFPVGKGASTWSDALGETGGSADAIVVTHSHTGPSHSHTASSGSTGSHTHSVTGTAADNRSRVNQGFSQFHGGTGGGFGGFVVEFSHGITLSNNNVEVHSHSVTGTAASDGAHSHSVTVDPAGTGATSTVGSSGTNANLPPYLTLNFIIRLT